jgi:hypothetical protein
MLSKSILVACLLPAVAASPALAKPQKAKNKFNINHIVVVMMENRSFDHLLGWHPTANGMQTLRRRWWCVAPDRRAISGFSGMLASRPRSFLARRAVVVASPATRGDPTNPRVVSTVFDNSSILKLISGAGTLSHSPRATHRATSGTSSPRSTSLIRI